MPYFADKVTDTDVKLFFEMSQPAVSLEIALYALAAGRLKIQHSSFSDPGAAWSKLIVDDIVVGFMKGY